MPGTIYHFEACPTCRIVRITPRTTKDAHAAREGTGNWTIVNEVQVMLRECSGCELHRLMEPMTPACDAIVATGSNPYAPVSSKT